MPKQKRRTKSEIFRETVRVYRLRHEERWVMDIIAQTKAEEARNSASLPDLLAEDEELVLYGEQQAKKLGIKTDMRSVNRLIHETRKARRS